MKALTTLLTTSLFAANAHAVEIYHGFADGGFVGPDLVQDF